jgi:uncharacterized membrane protein
MRQKNNLNPQQNMFSEAALYSGIGERIVSIDAVRGLAILMMVFSHGLHWFFTGRSHDVISLFGVNSVGDMATPFFYVISGAALYLSVLSRIRAQANFQELLASYARRFGQLFLVGVALSKTWGVLQAQAVSLFLVAAGFLLAGRYNNLRKSVKLVFAAGLVVLTVHYIAAGLPLTRFPAVFLKGPFPILAVLALNALGFCLGHRLKSRGLGLWTGLWGIALTASGLVLHLWLQPIRRIDMSLAFMLLGMGMVMLLLYVFNFTLLQKSNPVISLISVGKDALFLFVAHYLVFFAPLYLTDLLNTFNRPMAVFQSGLLTLGIIRMAEWRQYNNDFTVYGIMEWIFQLVLRPRSLRNAPWWLYLSGKFLQHKAGAERSMSEG